MNGERYRFAEFEFDAPTGELRRDGAVVRVQAQPAQALACLIARAGEVVTREELQRAIWGDETHVDFERGLNFCIGQVRAALEDDADTPRYVRTVPRRGYQFIAAVETEAPSAKDRKTRSDARSGPTWSVVFAGAATAVVLAFSAGYWLRVRASGRHQPVVAVARFDNESADAGMTRLSDGLTDGVVERLTAVSQGHYDVIGNAAILRVPREQRDLQAIAASLGANYVVLGQVQSKGAQTRILAHLIRLPDQKHLWVVRLDRDATDVLAVESEIAGQVASEFAWRVERDSTGPRLAALPGR
jgi:DNA-binding winged helix-turn-helix (wHTH) protein/TolB-like protein